MKRIFLYSLLACLSWTMQSCLFSEEDVFEQSSAERDNASVAGIKALLMSAENGWNLEYRYGEDGKWGVSNIFLKFDETDVTMASDYATGNYAPGAECKSLYKVQAYQGTVLSFDSYNEILHSFCEPEGYNEPGLIGDYEFIVRDTTSNTITLTGKKHGVEMVMTRLADDVDWTAYLQNTSRIADESDLPRYNVMVGGQKVGQIERSYIERSFFMTENSEDGSMETVYYPFICTEEGIHLMEPLTIGGATMQNLKWNADTETFVCTDEGSNVSLAYEHPEGFDRYAGIYVPQGAMTINQYASYIELTPYKKGRLYSYKLDIGYANFQFLFNYDIEKDMLYIDGNNKMGVESDGEPIVVYLGHEGNDGYFSYIPSHSFRMEGVESVDPSTGALTISFKAPEGYEGEWLLFIGSSIVEIWTDFTLTKIG